MCFIVRVTNLVLSFRESCRRYFRKPEDVFFYWSDNKPKCVSAAHAFNLLNFRLVNGVLCSYAIECNWNCWISLSIKWWNCICGLEWISRLRNKNVWLFIYISAAKNLVWRDFIHSFFWTFLENLRFQGGLFIAVGYLKQWTWICEDHYSSKRLYLAIMKQRIWLSLKNGSGYFKAFDVALLR